MVQHFSLAALCRRERPNIRRFMRCWMGILLPGAMFLLVSAAVGVGCTGCSVEAAPGRARFQLAAEIRQDEMVEVMHVSIVEVGLQSAGQTIGTGWLTSQPDRHEVDLATLRTGETVDLGAHRAPAGRYDRVRIVTEEGFAQLRNGDTVPLILTVEPIAAPFELQPGAEVDVLIKLIALRQADGGYELFTKSATVTPSP